MWALRDVSVVFFLTVCAFVEITFACGKYKLVVNKIENCGDDKAVVKVSDNFTIVLDRDCRLMPMGCVDVAGFQTHSLHFELDKKPFTNITGNVDVCKLTSSPTIVTQILLSLGLPATCPAKAERICMDGHRMFRTWNLRPLSMFLGLAVGHAKIKLESTYDTGTSCISIDAALEG